MTSNFLQRKNIDWPYIKKAALWFLVSALTTTSCWYISYHYMDSSNELLIQTERENSNIRRQISIAKQDASTIKKYQGAYQDLLASGLIGKEHRLSWVSSLRAIASKLKIKTANFQITAQTAAAPQLVNTKGMLQVRKSRMKLSLELSHEADLLQILATLDQQPGHFSANQCTIIRNLAKIIVLPSASNLSVRCELEWYSLNPNTNASAANE